MPVFAHPARGQFERLLAAGQTPTAGQPGSIAVNLVDRKLWTFDGVGAPVPLAYDIAAHDPDRAYATGQLILRDGALWQADTNLSPRAFNVSDWTPVSAENISAPSAPSATGVMSGGSVSRSGNTVSVTAGTGVIVDAEDPLTVTHVPVAWAAQTITPTAAGQVYRALVVTSAGVLAVENIGADAQRRRNTITLGFLEFDTAGVLQNVVGLPRVAKQTGQDATDLMAALGGGFLVDGAVLQAGAGLTLNHTGGTAFVLHGAWRNTPDAPNRVPLSAATGFSFDVIRASGERVRTAQTEVPLDVYDGGFIPAGFSAVHFVFADATGRKWVQLGLNVYASLTLARATIGAEWRALPAYLRQREDAFVLGAVVVTRQVLADLTGRVLPVRLGPQVGADFTLDQSESGFLRVDGLNPMQGDLDMGGNEVQNSIIDEGVF